MTTETTPAPVTTAQDTPQTDTTAPQTNDIPQAVSERGQELRKVVEATDADAETAICEKALTERGKTLKTVVVSIMDRCNSRMRAKAGNVVKWLELTADGMYCDEACKKSGVNWHELQGMAKRKEFHELRKLATACGQDFRAQYGERRAFNRAFRGVRRPVYQGGAKVGHVLEFSDKLAAMFLESFDPARFRQSSGGGAGGQTNVAVVVNWSFEAPAQSQNRAATDI